MNGTSLPIDLRNVTGTKAFGVRGTDWNLVKRNAESNAFEPVDKLESSLDSGTLDANYGIWQDKKVTEGFLFKRTVREQDGQIQADEVRDFPKFREDEMSHIWHRAIGADELYTFDQARVSVGPQGAQLDSEWTLYHGNWNRWWEHRSPALPKR